MYLTYSLYILYIYISTVFVHGSYRQLDFDPHFPQAKMLDLILKVAASCSQKAVSGFLVPSRKCEVLGSGTTINKPSVVYTLLWIG